MREHRPGGVDVSHDVDFPHRLDTFIAVFEASGCDIAGVGGEQADGAVDLLCRIHQSLDSGFVTDIDRGSRSADGGGNALSLGFIDVGDNDVGGTRFGHRHGQGFADSGAAAGDDCHSPHEVHGDQDSDRGDRTISGPGLLAYAGGDSPRTARATPR